MTISARLLLIALLIMGIFFCGAPGCDGKASTNPLLQRHRRGCGHWDKYEAARLAIRRQALLSSTSKHSKTQNVTTTTFHVEPSASSSSLESGPRRAPTKERQQHDILPIPEDILPTRFKPIETSSASTHRPRVLLIVRDTIKTALNTFHLFREYLHHPTYDPDFFVSAQDLTRIDSTFHTHSDEANEDWPWYWPFSNPSAGHIMSWMLTGSSTKSNKEVNRLVQDHLCTGEIDLDNLQGFRVEEENKRLDSAADSLPHDPFEDNFEAASVTISVPTGYANEPPLSIPITGLRMRSLTTVIREAFAHPLSCWYHFTPYCLWYQPPGESSPDRVHGELYTSEAFIQEHDKVQRAPLPPGESKCKLERTVAALMLWSDSTLLANFGTAKLWPIYMMLGNVSKYIRAQPSSGACHHLGYIPSLPDHIQDLLSQSCHHWNTQKKTILTHCRRELIHAVWSRLLDDAFLQAVKYGMVVKCADGIEWRVYPRIFTYLADYPEKALLATIRDNGKCLCPRCTIEKGDLDKMGLFLDFRRRLKNVREYIYHKIKSTRNAIYNAGVPIHGAAVQRILTCSEVPTLNAFTTKLGDYVSLPNMLVVDFMHEFELGVWKTLFIHILRVLYVLSPRGEKIEELNRRFRQVPIFGNTIRRFTDNVAEMKKMVARDLEDILQVSIPVFDGLFPEPLNSMVLTGLYRTAELHALLKLQLHTASTVDGTRAALRTFGTWMRKFRDQTAQEFDTKELPSEIRARVSRSTKNPNPTPQKRALNLSTYKFHSLGDHPYFIELLGTLDSYSTQLGEQAHRVAKRLYQLTQKRKASTVEQIGKLYRRRARLQREHQRRTGTASFVSQGLSEAESEQRYVVSFSINNSVSLPSFLAVNGSDPAITNFAKKLGGHLIRRLLGLTFDGETTSGFSMQDLQSIRITNDKLYTYKTLRINYTTYDMRRASETINPGGDLCNVMLLAAESGPSAQPFWYAKVLKIFRANVSSIGGPAGDLPPRWVTFLWVRWYGVEPGHRSGSKYARLPKVGFVPDADEDAFGFLDPAAIIRGTHLIQLFREGRTNVLLDTTAPTMARRTGETDDWVCFNVNIFADRDTYMRFRGGAIGHQHFRGSDEEVAGEMYEPRGDEDERMEHEDDDRLDATRDIYEWEEDIPTDEEEVGGDPDIPTFDDTEEAESEEEADVGDGYASM